MPRPLRLEVEGGIYHLIVRGNEQKPIFRDGADYEEYLERLAIYRERYAFRLYAYCLMSNHAHLALQRGTEPISRIMLALQSSYAQRFNRRHHRVGHLFQGRYKAFLVERERYLLALIRYIHMNPVKAGLVAKTSRYLWSSDRFYRRGRGTEWLDVDVILRILDPARSRAVTRYAALVDGIGLPPYEDATAIESTIKGDEAFADRVLGTFGRSPRRRRVCTVEQLAAIAARSEKLPLETLHRKGRSIHHSRIRAVVAYLGRRDFGIPVSRTAAFFGRDESTVARGVMRLEAELVGAPALRSRVELLSDAAAAANAETHGRPLLRNGRTEKHG